ncbi:hypothetical protein T10_4988 [Trichinella papuae]|uniref:Uncharacterized protein n=1 Tax=Trichinella papuae TaxID=268474 RepID=A0A0V1N7P0_9BILA|nr:hypothetical protein T10_4988 [Trichinella papuae]
MTSHTIIFTIFGSKADFQVRQPAVRSSACESGGIFYPAAVQSDCQMVYQGPVSIRRDGEGTTFYHSNQTRKLSLPIRFPDIAADSFSLIFTAGQQLPDSTPSSTVIWSGVRPALNRVGVRPQTIHPKTVSTATGSSSPTLFKLLPKT